MNGIGFLIVVLLYVAVAWFVNRKLDQRRQSRRDRSMGKQMRRRISRYTATSTQATISPFPGWSVKVPDRKAS